LSSLEDKLQSKQDELQSRLARIDAEITKLDESFIALAAEFNGTDGQASLKEAESIEQRLIQLRREKALTLASQSHVVKQMMDEKEARAEADRKALQATAKGHATAIIALNSEVDIALVQLRQLFERRASLLHQLSATGVANPITINKLEGKAGPTRACCAAGLHRFISLEKVSTQAFIALASCNVVLMGIGRDQHDDQSPIRDGSLRSNGDGNCGTDSVPRHRRNGGDA
jgi:hypothetical protein